MPSESPLPSGLTSVPERTSDPEIYGISDLQGQEMHGTGEGGSEGACVPVRVGEGHTCSSGFHSAVFELQRWVSLETNLVHKCPLFRRLIFFHSILTELKKNQHNQIKIVAASRTHSVRQNVTVDDAFRTEIYCNFFLLLLLLQKIKLTG